MSSPSTVFPLPRQFIHKKAADTIYLCMVLPPVFFVIVI